MATPTKRIAANTKRCNLNTASLLSKSALIEISIKRCAPLTMLRADRSYQRHLTVDRQWQRSCSYYSGYLFISGSETADRIVVQRSECADFPIFPVLGTKRAVCDRRCPRAGRHPCNFFDTK